MESTINQRFTKFLKFKKMDQKAFAEMANITEGTVSNIAKGKTKQPGYDFFRAIAWHWPEVNLRWLILNEDPMIIEQTQAHLINDSESKEVYQVQKREDITNLIRMVEAQAETISAMTKMLAEVPKQRALIEDLQRRLSDMEKKV